MNFTGRQRGGPRVLRARGETRRPGRERPWPWWRPAATTPHASITQKLITHLVSQGGQPHVKLQFDLHVVIGGQGIT